MEWWAYTAIALVVAVYVATRLLWRRKTYAEILSPYLAEHGCELVRVDIPRFYQTGPFPKLSVRMGAVRAQVMGVNLTHFEHRVVTFKDKNGNQCTRWVRMFISPLGAQDIIWAPGTTEVPDKKGWPTWN